MGPVIARKYPINNNSLIGILLGKVNVILNTPNNATKLNSKDMIVPIDRTERYRNPLLSFM